MSQLVWPGATVQCRRSKCAIVKSNEPVNLRRVSGKVEGISAVVAGELITFGLGGDFL